VKLIFASSNKHKADEIRQVLGESIQIILPSDLGYTKEIPETGTTLEENAWIKAIAIFEQFHLPVIADDTGLEVEALNGAPGVYSARFAGENATFNDNCNLLLHKLKGVSNRKAAFKTVICFLDENNRKHLFHGVVKGEILEHFSGEGGFGYDPVFRPEGYSKTFAEMTLEEKNKISHRALAIQKFQSFIQAMERHER